MASAEETSVADVKYMKQRSYNQSRGRRNYDSALGRPQKDPQKDD